MAQLELSGECSRDIVIRSGESEIWSSNLSLGLSQPFESLRGSDIVNNVPIAVEQCIALTRMDNVGIVYLVVECTRLGLWYRHDSKSVHVCRQGSTKEHRRELPGSSLDTPVITADHVFPMERSSVIADRAD